MNGDTGATTGVESFSGAFHDADPPPPLTTPALPLWTPPPSIRGIPLGEWHGDHGSASVDLTLTVLLDPRTGLVSPPVPP